MARAQLQLAPLRLATCCFALPRPPNKTRQPTSQGPGSRQGSQLEGRFFFFFFLYSLLGPPSSKVDGMGWESVSGGRQGSSKTNGPVMCSGSLLSPTRESPGPPGHHPSAAPCSVPDSCYASTRSSQHAEPTLSQAPPHHRIPISSLSISHQRPGGMTPGWARPPAENNKSMS